MLEAAFGEEQHICPRCEHYSPKDHTPGAFPGAVSRLDSKIEVCSACGIDEALGNGLVPREAWPIVVAAMFYPDRAPLTQGRNT